MTTDLKLNTAVLKEAMIKHDFNVSYLAARLDQHIGPVSAKLVQRWLDGTEQPQQGHLASLALLIQTTKQDLLSDRIPMGKHANREPDFEDRPVPTNHKRERSPNRKPIVELLKKGIYHQTTPERLASIIRMGEILPSGKTPEAAWPNTNSYSSFIESVALFNFGRATDKQIKATTLCWASVIEREDVSVFLRLNMDALPQKLQHSTQSMRQQNKQFKFLDHVESWHRGSIPWSAVNGCWELRLNRNGRNHQLTDLSHVLFHSNEACDEALMELESLDPALAVVISSCFSNFSPDQMKPMLEKRQFWSSIGMSKPSRKMRELIIKTIPSPAPKLS
jgi:hypothetical protein